MIYLFILYFNACASRSNIGRGAHMNMPLIKKHTQKFRNCEYDSLYVSIYIRTEAMLF